MEYPVMKVHPDQRGGSKLSPSMQSRRFQTTNLIRKTLAMWHFVGSRSTEENGRFADFVCRLDPDTLFLAERFRRFVQQQGLDRESMVYFGQVHHFMRGAPMSYHAMRAAPWAALRTGREHGGCIIFSSASEAAPYYTGSCVAEACPENSEGLDLGSGCSCKAGYSGTISPTQVPPFYCGKCELVPCPEFSTGPDVATGCDCKDGIGTVTPSNEAPFYVSTCGATN
eukprot:g7185.t1